MAKQKKQATSGSRAPRPLLMAGIGVLAGIFSGIVKFGWEVPFPPRTPERNMTNPPQALLELFGLPPDATLSNIQLAW